MACMKRELQLNQILTNLPVCGENDAKPEKIQTQTLRDHKYKAIKISLCTST